MDTLPEDLLKLIDKHTSYVEEILLVNSLDYDGPLKNDGWKNFLHQLDRRYDEFDDLFIANQIEMHILTYAIDADDLIACTHLLDRCSTDYSERGLLFKKSIDNKSTRIFKYLCVKFGDMLNNRGFVEGLFERACTVYNKEASDILATKFDWQVMIMNPASAEFVVHWRALAIFRFYILNPDNHALMGAIFDAINPTAMVGILSDIFNRKAEFKPDNYDWIYNIVAHYDNCYYQCKIFYILLNNLHLDIVSYICMQLGDHYDVLLKYFKDDRCEKPPKVDILRSYYEQGFINQDQVISIFKHALTRCDFTFLNLQTYIWVIEIIPLLQDEISLITNMLFTHPKRRYKEIFMYILNNREYHVNKYYIEDLEDLDVEIFVKLLKRDCIMYEDINEFVGCNEDCFIHLDPKLDEENRYNWISILITHSDTTEKFYDYIFTYHPELNYQVILEKVIKDYDETTSELFQFILDNFEKHGIRLSYKRLFNIAVKYKHVHLALLLNDKK